MKKFKLKTALGEIFIKLIHPRHLIKLIRLSREKKSGGRAAFDAQLKLYAQILPGDFLHYGYFKDPHILPEKTSLFDIQEAQRNYAELIISQINDKESPVLDIGCGTGGLLNMLSQSGLEAIGLTPDRFQTQYIKEKYPQTPVIRAKFEKIESERYQNHFGTLINSESLQYIKLDIALDLIKKLLKPGGRWIVVDYFRYGPATEKSGHHWDTFCEKLIKNNMRIIHKTDITKNVAPTLAYVSMWGNKLGLPLYHFLESKLQTKHPAVHYLLDGTLSHLQASLNKNLAIVDTQIFMREKKYMFCVIETD